MTENEMSFDDIPEGRGNGSNYYMIDLPKGSERLKVEKEETITAIIVPYVTTQSNRVKPGELFFMREYYLYRGLGPDKKSAYFDCRQTFNLPCPIADFAKEQGIELKPQRKALFNLFVLDIDGVEVNKPYVLDFSFANFAGALRTGAENKSKRRGQEHAKVFMSPTNGSFVTWTWKENTFNGKKFYKAEDFDFVPHKGFDGKMKELIGAAVDLDKVLNRLEYADAKARFIDGAFTAPDATETTKPSQEKAKPSDDAVAKAQAAATDPSAFDANWE